MKFIFFIKRVSDFDHLIPLAIKLIDRDYTYKEIGLYELFPDYSLYNIEKDFRYKILQENKLEFKKNFFGRYYLKLITVINFFSFIKNPTRYLFIFIKLLINRIFTFFYKVRLFFIFYLNDFEYIFTDHGNTLFDKEIIKKARKKRIKIFSLPHGLVLHNGYSKIKYHNQLYKKQNINKFSKIFFTNEFHFNLSNYKNLKIENNIIGSMRYSKEWINVLKKKISNLKNINEDKNIKIVIFEEKEGVSINNQYIPWINKENLKKIIEHLFKFKNITLTICKHPSLNESYLSKNKSLYEKEKSTFEVVFEADIVIGCLTSSICDAVVLNKRVIFLPYCHYFKNTLKNYLSKDLIANNFDEFKLIIRNHMHNIESKKENKFQENFYKKFIDNNKTDIFDKYISQII